MKYLIAIALVYGCLMHGAFSQTVIPLYSDSIPNSKPAPDEEKVLTSSNGTITCISLVSHPTLTIYLPPKEKANGTAVIVIPGGGYSNVCITHEGYAVAERFVEMGIAAFVLKYRIPNDKYMIDKSIGPVQDAQRAIQLVREKAKEFGIDKDRVGILGFSAGGHLASTAGTHFQHHYIDVKRNVNLRPDFMILIYPVISFADSIAHRGSRNNLIGKDASPEMIKKFSNELQITKRTPPTYLVHAEDDDGVKLQNTLVFGTALQKNKVPFDFYLYEKGGHGFGLINSSSNVKWMDLVHQWMLKSGWLNK
jgi:acetyl esterase/lipase